MPDFFYRKRLLFPAACFTGASHSPVTCTLHAGCCILQEVKRSGFVSGCKSNLFFVTEIPGIINFDAGYVKTGKHLYGLRRGKREKILK